MSEPARSDGLDDGLVGGCLPRHYGFMPFAPLILRPR